MLISFLFCTDGLEEGTSVKKARASSVDDVHAEPDQSLDEQQAERDAEQRGDQRGDQRGRVPPGFLSPSVQEYLELGKSIPGESSRAPADAHSGALPQLQFHISSKRVVIEILPKTFNKIIPSL